MKHSIFIAGLCLAVLQPVAFAAAASSNEAGQGLHAKYCTACHDTGVYTRKERKIGSLDALNQQVQGCGHMSKHDLSAAENQSIIKYLNDQFYRFK